MNRLPAEIIGIDMQGSIALIDAAAGKLRFTAMLVGAPQEIETWQAGMPVTLLFKEAEVSLARHLSGMISMRNRIAGTVTALEPGKLLTRVTLDAEGHRIESVITTRSAIALGLAIGVGAEALIKANEVSVMPLEQA
ncbi:TOBE domain-containing protein [Noviherbaspirillum galbum]|uniref:Mop domain-containing protein n=1 Tax=Noviherbaspirillum galbum TaxID=2709383 RepID=A0A6B3SYD3_9BURK|nr:TOBE domain-containing protein [Noviherbaspirillum galbum]NEX64366.1 hypothetical protein [Noviherbaspirillum galbum]